MIGSWKHSVKRFGLECSFRLQTYTLEHAVELVNFKEHVALARYNVWRWIHRMSLNAEERKKGEGAKECLAGSMGDEEEGERSCVLEACELLEVDPDVGLREEEAAFRLRLVGPNAILAPSAAHTSVMFSQLFLHPVQMGLWIVALVLLSIFDFVSLLLIALIIVINAASGLYEFKYCLDSALSMINHFVPYARVLRNRYWSSILSSELTPGDIVSIGKGDQIPADVIFTRTTPDFLLDESFVNGDPALVPRQAGGVGRLGCVCWGGYGEAVVVSTGWDSQMGACAALKTGSSSESLGVHSSVLRVLLYACYFVLIPLFIVQLIVTLNQVDMDDIDSDQYTYAIEGSLAMAISGIPMWIHVIFSVVVFVGAVSVMKKDAILMHMRILETMARMDILLVDNNASLLRKKYRVLRGRIYPLQRSTKYSVLIDALMSCKQKKRSVFEDAIVSCLKEDYVWKSHKLLFHIVRDGVNIAKIKDVHNEQVFRVAMGEVDAVLRIVRLSPKESVAIQNKLVQFDEMGYRVVAVANAKNGSDPLDKLKWELTGLIPFVDPVRPESSDHIQRIRELGIDVKVIFNDKMGTAKEMSRQMTIDANIVDLGKALEIESLNGHDNDCKSCFQNFELCEEIEDADGLANIKPGQKFEVVNMLQSRGHTVGLTGCELEDVPALKASSVGIASHDSSDGVRASSDLNVLKPGLPSLYQAICISRQVLRRMKSYSLYALAVATRNVLFLFFAANPEAVARKNSAVDIGFDWDSTFCKCFRIFLPCLTNSPV
eukprot:Nk52_evm42s208 gene=Nk52_evmTU42s208